MGPPGPLNLPIVLAEMTFNSIVQYEYLGVKSESPLMAASGLLVNL